MAQASTNEGLERYVTLAQAINVLGISPWTLREWERTGKLKAAKMSERGQALYDRLDLEALQTTDWLPADYAMLAAILDSSEDAIITKTLDGIIRTWNPAAERMFGYSAQEAVGQPITLIIPPERHDEESQILARLRQGERVTHFKTIRQAKEGRLVHLSLTISPMRDAEGKLIGASKIARDISEQKQTEDELRRVASLPQENPSPVLRVAPSGELLYSNPAGNAVFLKEWHREVGEQLLPDICNAVASVWKSGQKNEVEFRLGDRIFSCVLTPVINRGYVNLYGRDVTDQRNAERAVRESEERFRLAMEAAAVGVWDFYPLQGKIMWPPVAREMWGIPDNLPVTWEKWRDQIHPEDCERAVKAVIASLDPDGSGLQDDCYRVMTPQGEVRWVAIKGRSVFDTVDGVRKAVRVYGTLQDVTALKLAELAAERQRAEAEAANQAKNRFLAVLSHELRTPLTPVMMTLAALDMDETLPSSAKQDVQMIRKNLELEVQLIDDLLDVTRITHGKLRLVSQSVNLHEVIEHVVDICRFDARTKKLNLTFVGRAKNIWVYGDPARLEQAFWNLLKNAIKFTPPQGRITIETVNSTHEDIQIIVSDNGVGIAPEVIQRIFQPFEQGEQTVTRAYGGLGLGLAITKAIVELHQGEIHCQSQGIGHGATFTVRFPLDHSDGGEPASAEKMSTTSANKLAGIRVLLVDDHLDTVRVAQRLLRSMGLLVSTADTVKTAIEVARNSMFDILISDIGLPDGSGLDLIRQLHQIQKIPAIAMSGFGTDLDHEKSCAAGFSAHLNKPVNFDQLLGAIAQLTDRA